MEVKMNKEIRNYQESMFMGLNLRQCIFSLLAIAVAVGIYFGLGKYVGQEMINPGKTRPRKKPAGKPL